VFLDIYYAEVFDRRVIAAQKEREQMAENGHKSVDNLININ
jgi:hypothetical protein